MIVRNDYLLELHRIQRNDNIKIISGVSQSGKSTILSMYMGQLERYGVQENNVIDLNNTEMKLQGLTTSKRLLDYFKDFIRRGRYVYIFMEPLKSLDIYLNAIKSVVDSPYINLFIEIDDESQIQPKFVKVLRNCFSEVHIQPLSFKEIVLYNGLKNSLNQAYNKYITNGAFPFTLKMSQDFELAYELYYTALMKEAISRHKINKSNIFVKIVNHLFDNVTISLSIKNIQDLFSKSKNKASNKLIEEYLQSICQSYMFYKINNYDIKNNLPIKDEFKMFPVDVGLRKYISKDENISVISILEHIVFLELKRRKISTYYIESKNDKISFLTISEYGKTFLQIVESVNNQEEMDLAISSFKNIKNPDRKIILSLDYTPRTNYGDVTAIHLLSWLIEE